MAEIDLQPSRLGTKEHWDNVYADEFTNFNDFGDEGEVWFGQDSVEKMVSWALEYVPPSSSSSSSSKDSDSNSALDQDQDSRAYTYTQHPSILEIGTGNGTLLCALAEAGYPPTYLAGIDYSPDAVRLARGIAEQRGVLEITFEEADFLVPDIAKTLPLVEGMTAGGETGAGRSWDVVMDKGTYDAMALAERDSEGKHPCDEYPIRVAEVLKPGGYFLITSCNFTRDELLKAFVTPKTGFSKHSEIEHKSISFGGVQGSTYCSIAFQKAVAS